MNRPNPKREVVENHPTARGAVEGRSPSTLNSPFPLKERGVKGVR